MQQKPLIGIPCDVKQIGHFPFHAVGDKYVVAAAGAAGGVPLLLPSLGDAELIAASLELVDGVLLPGSPSNIEPHHYSAGPSREGTLHDVRRDATTLPLARLAIERGVPLLGICRGFQEVNVVMGGTLHQHVQEEPGMLDHREPDTDDLDLMYGEAHDIRLLPDSWIAGWAGSERARVNSIHQQGIRTLGEGLVAEAVADDGLIEAYRVEAARAFAYAVQWHPEWKYWENPLSRKIFEAFGEACRQRRQRRNE
ncbi:gamma-glutamyl-gamma-aminobutyrate hydrolase family protein [Crenobacter caeni]|uniref:gamma-glutamyl-gamma-aminobutyrate hydrolase n=1 Tax=Crenobacter caeni TaxID=2705474 RepID=A0A6B2KRJ4_9NEIS|nr:gamma-glutamyl-gamma-aminobutyrate hydrolase family protein [Crenobacter caeni]NDV12547.1 gamma-glutamyl-gamma-aminobutyrate hydrolase family protein [Crenobacter caeni]